MPKNRPNLAPPSRPNPSRSDSKAIVEAILGATSQLPLDATIQDIADRAGVGVASIYRYFPGKDAIYAELGRHLHFTLRERTLAVFAEVTDLEECARRCAELAIERAFGQQEVIAHVHLKLPFTWHNDEAHAITQELVVACSRMLDRFLVGTEEQLTDRAAMLVMMLKGTSRLGMMYPEVAPPSERQQPLLEAALLACATAGLERRSRAAEETTTEDPK